MRKTTRTVFILFFIFISSGITLAQDIGVTAARDIDRILPVEQRARIMNEILEWRLDHIVPELMRRERIDIWITICREYNEDPVYMTLVPEPHSANSAGTQTMWFSGSRCPGNSSLRSSRVQVSSSTS